MFDGIKVIWLVMHWLSTYKRMTADDYIPKEDTGENITYTVVDINTTQCNLSKDGILHLADECFASGWKDLDPISLTKVRLFFTDPINAKEFADLYSLHPTRKQATRCVKPAKNSKDK